MQNIDSDDAVPSRAAVLHASVIEFRQPFQFERARDFGFISLVFCSRSRLAEAFDTDHPERLPRHKIFISHSGKQKDFAEQLCKDLEACNYSPFFDKRPHSLPKGQHFPTRIFKAARECFLAIVLLSEEFLSADSKWPMLELAAFVCAQRDSQHVQILPVLLGNLQPQHLKDTARWVTQWTNGGERDTRIDARKWETAVLALLPLNMIVQSKFDGEVALRSEIVNAVLRSIPPDVRSDVSHVQGKDGIYKDIMERFSEIGISQSRSKIVGVYGVAGVGKSTACMILTHLLNGEFEGRVCHVEFGKGEYSALINLQRQALKQLTGANQDYLYMHINHEAQGWTCLKERMCRQRVFLALDNVSGKGESWEAATKFLYDLHYEINSMVVVTSRSKDVLEELLAGIPESCCVCCPSLNKEEAEKMVLDHVGVQNVEVLTNEQRRILQKTVEMCDFGGFHPMALKLLATQLGRKPSSWKLSSFMFNSEASDGEHMLFKQMETIFLSGLDQKTRDIFMDIALFTPEIVNNGHELCRWLRDTRLQPYGSTVDGIKNELNVLRSKSLLEVWSHDSDNVCVHDLHRDLAKQRTLQMGNEAGRYVYHETRGEYDTSLMSELTERACFVATSNTKMGFDRCSMTLKLLSARSCSNLAELNLQGLAMLVSLELSACYELGTLDLKGLTKLRWLCLTSCESLKTLYTSGCEALMSVCMSNCNRLQRLKIKYSKTLESVSVSYNEALEVVDLGSGECLRRLDVWFCEGLREVKASKSVCLDEFKKRGCPLLGQCLHGCNIVKLSQTVSCLIVTRWHRISEELTTALEASRCLQVLDLWECTMSRLPDLRNCYSLRELKLSEVDVLLDSDNTALLHEYVDILCASSDELALPLSLQQLSIGNCRNTVVKEICWKLQGLKNILVLSMQTVRVSWDWELYRSGTKVFSQILCPDNALMCNLESLRDQLHQKIGILEPEEITSDESERIDYSDESEQSCSDDERADETGTNSVEIAGEGRSFQLTAHISAETPSKASSFEQISHDKASFACNKCEEPSTFIKMLSNVIYWIREFLRDTDMQSELKGIMINCWQKQPGQFALGKCEDIWQSWERLFMSDQMRNVHYRSPNYVLLETFNNFDTLRELFNKQGSSNNAYDCKLISDKLSKRTVEQLRQQLHVLQALVPGQNCLFDFEPWELKVMDDIFVCDYNIKSSLEKAAEWSKLGSEKVDDEEMMWEKLPGDGILLTRRKLEELNEICISLMQRRQWVLEDANKKQDDLGKWKQDWLKSCKVCLSIQVFCILLNERDLQAAFSLHRQWFSEMMQEVNCLFQRRAEKLLTTSTGGVVDDVELEDLSRAWKAQQWLQKLALSLSTKWVEEDIRKILSFIPAEVDLVSRMKDKLLHRKRSVSVNKKLEFFLAKLISEWAWLTPTLFASEGIPRLMSTLFASEESLEWLGGKHELKLLIGEIDWESLGKKAETDLATREKTLKLLEEYFRQVLAVVEESDMAKVFLLAENISRIAALLTDGEENLRVLMEIECIELQRKYIDVGAMQNKIKRALQSLPFVEWEANDILYWVYKYNVIENVIRDEGLPWAYSCTEGGTLHPSNDWKEAALHYLWDEGQAFELVAEKRGELADELIELFEEARVRGRVHDMLFRLQLIDLSAFDEIHENFVKAIFDSRWRIGGIRNVEMTAIRKWDFNCVLTTYLEIDLAQCLQGFFPSRGIVEDAIISTRMRERRVVASQHDSGLQKWAKAEEFPLRTLWEAVNSARLPLVLPKLRHCHISINRYLLLQEAL